MTKAPKKASEAVAADIVEVKGTDTFETPTTIVPSPPGKLMPLPDTPKPDNSLLMLSNQLEMMKALEIVMTSMAGNIEAAEKLKERIKLTKEILFTRD